jgi:hypothetical protein
LISIYAAAAAGSGPISLRISPGEIGDGSFTARRKRLYSPDPYPARRAIKAVGQLTAPLCPGGASENSPCPTLLIAVRREVVMKTVRYGDIGRTCRSVRRRLTPMPFGNLTEPLSRRHTMKTAQEARRACLGRQRRHSYQPRATPWVLRPKTILSAESAIHCLAGLRPAPQAASGFELVGPKEPYDAGRWPMRVKLRKGPSVPLRFSSAPLSRGAVVEHFLNCF